MLPQPLLILLLLLGITSPSFGADVFCEGKIGGTSYSLQSLSDATKGVDVTCQDWLGNTFYYRPCNFLQQVLCKTMNDPVPGACQKDTRRPPKYHDCGSTNAVAWFISSLSFGLF